MRAAFVTCVQLGLDCMEEIYQAGGRLDLALTLQDDIAPYKSGRVYLDDFCRRHAIDLVKVRNVNNAEAVAAVGSRGVDWLFIIGWSQIVRKELLGVPRMGAIGMHPTLLPEGRGRAAIPWTILKGLTRSGVTMFQLDAGVDTGPVLAQERFEVAADETATSLYQRVALAHRTLIRSAWPAIAANRVNPLPQDESKATEWPKRTPADGAVSRSMDPGEVDRLVRATTHPYPGAFYVQEGRTIRIWSGQAARAPGPPPDGALRIALDGGAYDALEFEME